MTRLPFHGAVPAAALATVLAACSPADDASPAAGAGSARNRPNVVLICLDTVRADHLGTYGYERRTTPNLDALAERSLVFEDTSATAGWTKPSVPSFLTGTYPSQHGVYQGSARRKLDSVTDLLPRDARTLAEVFEENGYRTGAVVHNAQLRRGNGFEQGFEDYDQGYMHAREIRWRGLDWLDEAGDDGRPFFLYLHFLDAHWPYPTPDEWIEHFAPAELTERFRGGGSDDLISAINHGEHEMTAEDREAIVAVYDTALAYLDFELGRLFRGLEQRGLADDTLVCIVSDHGEEFGEHGRIGHGHGLWEGLLRVPWILHVPGTPPARNATPVSLVDLFPTLLAGAGLDAPPTEGVNRLAEPDVRRAILAEHKGSDSYAQTYRSGSDKLHREFEAPANEGVETLLLPLLEGSRWEVEFEREGGRLVATQLKPRDEDPDDDPEIKGHVEALESGSFRLEGVLVEFDADTELQSESDGSVPALAEGMLVKVRGEHDDGVVEADRIRIYPPGEENPSEIRGTIEAVRVQELIGEVVISGFTVVLTTETELKGVESFAEPSFLRSNLVHMLEAGASTWAAGNGYTAGRALYDLAADPVELSPRPVEPGGQLERMLDELGRRLVRTRVFGEKDEMTLDATAIEELRVIGYGGE